MGYVIITPFGLAVSVVFLLLGGYRFRHGRIVTVTPFMFLMFREAKRAYHNRTKGGFSIEQEETEFRRYFHVAAASPPALLAAQLVTEAF